MASLDIISAMIDYHYATHRRVWSSIMTLTDEQFTADIAHSRGSIRNQMVHLTNTDSGWLRGLRGDPNVRSRRYDPDDYTTLDSIRASVEAVAAEVTAYVAALTADDLERRPEGLPLTMWQTLLHLVNHGTDHRAQILRALSDFGAETFDQDIPFHFMGR